MKERVAYIFLLLLLVSLVLFGGCFSKVKELDKISGPTWVTSLTMPLVTRIEEEGYEIRLGDASNAQGEEGLGLTGKSLYSYRLEPEEGSDSFGWKERLDTVEVELGQILDIELHNPDPGTYPVNNAGVTVELTDPDFAGVTLSDAYTEGALNDITITITNGRAGPGGVRFVLVNYEGGVPGAIVTKDDGAEIPEGATTGHLKLNEATIPPNMYITVDGNVEATEANARITFTGSNLEIAAVTVDENKLADLYEIEETIDLGTADLGEDLPEITLKTASLEFTYDLPDNLRVTAMLKVEGKDNSGVTIGSRELAIILPGTELQYEFKDELNDILNLKPSSLAFSLTGVELSPITGDTVEVELGKEISFKAIPEVGIATVITDPEEMEVPEKIRENPLQAFMMYLVVKNTSPAGFDLTVHLSPEPQPVLDSKAVKISLSIAPAEQGEPGVFDSTNDPIILTTAQLDYLTSGDRFYNQIEFENQSIPGEISNDDYIEIRAWAQVDILVNKKEEEAD